MEIDNQRVCFWNEPHPRCCCTVFVRLSSSYLRDFQGLNNTATCVVWFIPVAAALVVIFHKMGAANSVPSTCCASMAGNEKSAIHNKISAIINGSRSFQRFPFLRDSLEQAEYRSKVQRIARLVATSVKLFLPWLFWLKSIKII